MKRQGVASGRRTLSSLARNHAPDHWLNLYDLRRESMWLADV